MVTGLAGFILTIMESITVQSVLPAASSVSVGNRASLAATQTEADFQQILSLLMSGSLSGSSGSTQASSSSLLGGSSSNNIMMPAMFAMVQELLMRQMALLQSGKATPVLAGQQNELTTEQAQELRQPTALVANQRLREQASAQVVGKLLEDNLTVPVTSANGSVPHGQPVQGPLTQSYHGTHYGLDFGIPVGTQVRSSMEGKVISAGWNNEGYGNLVIVQNGDYLTYYAHLSKIPVTVGQNVKAGSVVGISGNTGNSTGPHLHYEVRYKGRHVDPTKYTLNVAL